MQTLFLVEHAPVCTCKNLVCTCKNLEGERHTERERELLVYAIAKYFEDLLRFLARERL